MINLLWRVLAHRLPYKPCAIRADCSTMKSDETYSENDTLRPTCELSDGNRIGIYAGATGFAIVINFARTIMFYFVCVNASRVLHNRMFASVLRAPVYFFDTNPIGEHQILIEVDFKVVVQV